jgi:hypothetical protein
MYLCFRPYDEKKSLLTSTTRIINYQTILTSPYAHVIRDDKISIESSNVIDANTTDTYLLFNGEISDQAYETGLYHIQTSILNYFVFLSKIACFSFDDTDVNTPVVLATTTTTNGHFLFERLFEINHVTSPTSIRMRQINPKNTISSNTVSMARPFDEFLTSLATMPNTPLDVQSNNIITKSDKD